MSNLQKVSAETLIERLTQPHVIGAFADFTNCLITDPLDLTGADLCGVDFSNSRFEGPVDFGGAHFFGLSWFKHVEFLDRSRFGRTCFSNDARFDSGRFSMDAEFPFAEFRGIGTFDRTAFDRCFDLTGAVAYGNFSLADAKVSGDLALTEAAFFGGLWSPAATFATVPAAAGLEIHGRQVPHRF